MPQLAVFPKAYMRALCLDGSLTLSEWIDQAASLDVDGMEWYSGFLEMADSRRWNEFRQRAADSGLSIPMLCCSPDFTHPDAQFRNREMAKQKSWIDMTHALGGSFCRVLSGQRRPELSREAGIALAAECIQACLPYAADRGISLVLENHYKDDFWEYPEFVQDADSFCELLDQIVHPAFGVNFDPSNAWISGTDPQDLLLRISRRVITMHASDRYLAEGTWEDLRKEEQGVIGYARRLRHGEIGKGIVDYDALFGELRRVGFDGWISIEDGVDGLDQLAASAAFLRKKIARYWPT